MRKLLIVSLLLILSYQSASAGTVKQLKVVVLDTGISSNHFDKNFLCPSGHRDFTKTSLEDVKGHGTHISGLIDQYAKDIFLSRYGKNSDTKVLNSKKLNYCQIIIKFYHLSNHPSSTMSTYNAALEYAISLKPNIINISAGGEGSDDLEQILIKKALDQGTIVVAAAGNNGKTLNKIKGSFYFPAMYDDRVIVVGNGINKHEPAYTSNRGPLVKVWENGEKQLSLGIQDKDTLSGTSQATAVFTGKLIKYLLSTTRK